MMSERMSQLWLMQSDNINEFCHQSPLFPGQALAHILLPPGASAQQWPCWRNSLLCAWRRGFRDTTVEMFRTTKRNKADNQWPRGLRSGSVAARLLGLWVRIPPRTWISVCCECYVSSGRGLCDELITRPEESYRVCFTECDQVQL
jgi:hypothetical protein